MIELAEGELVVAMVPGIDTGCLYAITNYGALWFYNPYDKGRPWIVKTKSMPR